MKKTAFLLIVLLIFISGCISNPLPPTAREKTTPSTPDSETSCGAFPPDLSRDDCYRTQGVEKGDITICNKIQDSQFKSDCYGGVAVTTENLSLIQQVSDFLSRTSAYRNLAIKKGDPSICGYIDDAILNEKDVCYEEIALSKKDSVICENIMDEDLKWTCYNELSLVYEKKVVPEKFPSEFFNKSREYLISKFGEKIFNDAIGFVKAEITSSFPCGGGQWFKEYNGEGYMIEYIINMSKYVELPPEVTDIQKYYGYRFVVVFDPEGELVCTTKTVDCNTYPSFCPPFSIDSFTEATKYFKSKCKGNFTDRGFYFYQPSAAPTPVNESRFLWQFSQVSCGHHCATAWDVYLDPQTGAIVSDENGICSKDN
jgi:hypothetical protein